MSANTSAKTQLKSAIIKSAAVHVCVFLLLIISPAFNVAFKDDPMDVVWVELPKGIGNEIGLGIKESKGLPETTIEQQKEPPAVTQEPMEAQPRRDEKTGDREPNIEKTVTATPRMAHKRKKVRRRRGTTATDRKIANALAAIDRSLASRTAAPESAQMEESGGSNGYRYGTGTRPLRVPPSDPEYLKYQAQVRAQIISNWIVPEHLTSQGKDMTAKLVVMINMDGEVISTRWADRSGNPSYDASCKRAVEKSSPLPKPPARLAWETYNEGFLIAFDARVR